MLWGHSSAQNNNGNKINDYILLKILSWYCKGKLRKVNERIRKGNIANRMVREVLSVEIAFELISGMRKE